MISAGCILSHIKRRSVLVVPRVFECRGAIVKRTTVRRMRRTSLADGTATLRADRAEWPGVVSLKGVLQQRFEPGVERVAHQGLK